MHAMELFSVIFIFCAQSIFEKWHEALANPLAIFDSKMVWTNCADPVYDVHKWFVRAESQRVYTYWS